MVTKTKTSIVKTTTQGDGAAFGEVLQLIQSAKQRAYQAVNSELVALY